MELHDARHAIDLSTTPLHLGLGSRARRIDGFAWTPEVLQEYLAATEGDAAEGRLVVLVDGEGPGDHWERHPAGDEVVVCLHGTATVRREGVDEDAVRLRPGQATVNPAGVWHAVDTDGSATLLTITPGVGTEHRHRERSVTRRVG